MAIMKRMFNKNAQVISRLIRDDGVFPNNNKLPLLIYKQVFAIHQSQALPSSHTMASSVGRPSKHPSTSAFEDGDLASQFEMLFERNQWCDGWRSVIFPYHHYHTTAHETLGVYRGFAKVRFGGDNESMSFTETIHTGDVVVIPVGVSHKCLQSSDDFSVVGVYPDGQIVDMFLGKLEEREKAFDNMAKTALPSMDPVFGNNGPLFVHWK